MAGGGGDLDRLLDVHGAELVVVKDGPFGATVHQRGTDSIEVPAYRSDSVFKIGSGDVFSAVFAAHWGERCVDPVTAADFASRSVAQFVAGHVLPVPCSLQSSAVPLRARASARVYLAGPFFDLGQRWLIQQAFEAFSDLGVDVFSPLHEVGVGLTEDVIAEADLAGLRTCTAVWAALDGTDPGTLFEVGYARALGIPVVALTERMEAENLTMFRGTGCEVVHDFASSIYRTVWVGA